jgi:hypothetical protein
VQNAQDLLDGKEAPSIPVGNIMRDDPSINEPWSWHIDPASVEFADMTTEVCDGLPEYVEDGTHQRHLLPVGREDRLARTAHLTLARGSRGTPVTTSESAA